MNDQNSLHVAQKNSPRTSYQITPPLDSHAVHAAPIPSLYSDWQFYFQYCCNDHISPPFFHVQELYEIIVLIRTYRKYLTETNLFEAGSGDVFLFAPGERHMGIHIKDPMYERYYFYIHPLLIAQLPDSERILHLFHRTSYIKNRITLPKDIYDTLTPKKLLIQSADIEPLTPISFFYQLLSHLMQIPETTTGVINAANNLLTEILNYINTSYADIPSASAIASHFSISSSYLSRLFSELLELSPYQYLMHIRLDEARRMLMKGASVTEACYACGFSDCSHFIQYFKRKMGITPAKLRKMQST